MLIQKTNPVGIDVPIQSFQSFIHARLLTAWVGDLPTIADEYKSYGRASRNKTDDGYIAEVLQAGNSYKEVYWDNSLTAISFFGIGQRMNSEIGKLLTDVHLVFFVNLKKIKPAIAHRADEEVRKDVFNACSPGMYGFQFDGLELSVENVLREYPGSRRDERLKYVDMQPVHCFRLNFSINYNINICSSLNLS
jgi:hypothetical protein